MFPIRAATALAALALAIAIAAWTAGAEPARTGYPNSMAATGDSITRAFNTCTFPFMDCPNNSWSTGGSSTVKSHYYRIRQQNSSIDGNNFNDAVSGAKMVDLPGQVGTVNGRNVEYVTILMGANDVCTSSESTMTSVSTFRSQFEQAMASLSAGSPSAAIAVGSIPNVYRLWEILHTDPDAVSTWNFYGICQSLLENATSTAQADQDRRERVRQRNIDFNTQLREVCAQYIHCRYDNDAAFGIDFVPSDVSTRDYFHPSIAGQTKAASVSWAVTFDFSDGTAPVSTASTAPVAGGIEVTITASDNVGISGIEYKIDGGAFQKYAGPFTVASGSMIEFRAVDVNGNNEATQSLTVGGTEPTATFTPTPTPTTASTEPTNTPTPTTTPRGKKPR